MNYLKHFKVALGSAIKLRDVDADFSGPYKHKEEAAEPLESSLKEIFDLQLKLYAESRRALLIVVQAMDTGGKDGLIRSVFSGVNPQGCRVTSFKAPSAEEAAHDFLWRIHQAVPPKGYLGIFNRSQYEEVLTVRVHKLLPKNVWAARYEQINAFEKLLAQNGVVILKFYLHISKDEQKKRLQSRIDDPLKNWKFEPNDLKERALWDDYSKAYEEALTRCSTKWAPWFIIPANKKWFRNLAVAKIIEHTMKGMDIQ
ncbi:MAG TPA: polyphosphate kinase 2 family protein, partial [Verrucomicrobiae bacterium]